LFFFFCLLSQHHVLNLSLPRLQYKMIYDPFLHPFLDFVYLHIP
jgi:hypothetical protein